MTYLRVLMITLLASTGVAQAEQSDHRKAESAKKSESKASPAPQSITLESLLNPTSEATTGVSSLRTQMLTEAGKTVGFRGGMAARAQVLGGGLNGRAERLDAIFRFSPLINKKGTMPPVIVEARDLTAFARDQIRTANRVYKIVQEERFVSVPPTWRDYLFVGLPIKGRVELPALDARPQNSNEEEIWREAVKAGWDEGQAQADAILAANFKRLTRDYSGMILYSTLLQQGMISKTKVAESRRTVTSDSNGKQLVLGDTLRRVTQKASFEADPNKWQPTTKSDRSRVEKAPSERPSNPPLPEIK